MSHCTCRVGALPCGTSLTSFCQHRCSPEVRSAVKKGGNSELQISRSSLLLPPIRRSYVVVMVRDVHGRSSVVPNRTSVVPQWALSRTPAHPQRVLSGSQQDPNGSQQEPLFSCCRSLAHTAPVPRRCWVMRAILCSSAPSSEDLGKRLPYAAAPL